jgi:hypothetical protein
VRAPPIAVHCVLTTSLIHVADQLASLGSGRIGSARNHNRLVYVPVSAGPSRRSCHELEIVCGIG